MMTENLCWRQAQAYWSRQRDAGAGSDFGGRTDSSQCCNLVVHLIGTGRGLTMEPLVWLRCHLTL